MEPISALIVGGGPAGASAAIALARGGAKPVVIERTAGPHDVVCGGFLGWDALASLRALGLDPVALGAHPIHRVRLISDSRAREAALPRPAAGLSRRRLDAALLALAAEAGVAVLRGRSARALDGRRIRLDDGEELEADALFLATGKHELRGAARETDGYGMSVGLRAVLPADPALDGLIELHLFDGGYAGLLRQEDGTTNLCLTVARARMAGGREALFDALAAEAPLLAGRLDAARAGPWEAVSGVPYGWRARSASTGCYRLGDQAAVIASLAGDGIAIALASGAAAARAFLAGESPDAYQRGFARAALRPVRVAETLRFMAARPARRRLMMGLAGLPGVAGAAARLTRIG